MDIKAYAYVESNDRTLCFGGDTGSGNDMRKIPCCGRCGRMINDHCIT